jgi:hypothetical protein
MDWGLNCSLASRPRRRWGGGACGLGPGSSARQRDWVSPDSLGLDVGGPQGLAAGTQPRLQLLGLRRDQAKT